MQAEISIRVHILKRQQGHTKTRTGAPALQRCSPLRQDSQRQHMLQTSTASSPMPAAHSQHLSFQLSQENCMLGPGQQIPSGANSLPLLKCAECG